MTSLRLIVSLLAAVPSGCAVMARQQKDQPLAAERIARLEKGMTASEVTEILGAPQDIIFSNKEHDPLREHAYVYEHKKTKYTAIAFGFLNFANADEKWDRVVVFFDDQGRVEHVGASLYADESSYGFPFGR